MPSVKVHIPNAQLQLEVTGPGSPLDLWAKEVRADLITTWHRLVEDNLESNAKHRGGVTGGYRAGIGTEQYRNQHGIQFKLTNDAPHAWYAEKGRGASTKRQYFSWSRRRGHATWYKATRARGGQNAMRNTMNRVMPRHTDAYTPLT